MKRIFVYIISVALLVVPNELSAQFNYDTSNPDSIIFPLNIRIGADIANPVLYLVNGNTLNIDGYANIDINEKLGFSLNSGYTDYNLDKLAYEYKATGIYFKPGVDFNILKPQIAEGKYWAGVGIRYGISIFSFETPSMTFDNYWGTTTSVIPAQSRVGHFVEISPGFSAKISDHFTLGWRANISKLIYTGTEDMTRPVYVPGYGTGDKGVAFSFNYYLSFSFSYKTINAKFKEGNAGANYEEMEETTDGSDSSSLF